MSLINTNKTHLSDEQPDIMIYINTTPLIDVMLVLLIMLIITIPVKLHSVNLDLPEKNSEVTLQKKDVFKINIDEFGLIKIDSQIIKNRESLRLVLAGFVKNSRKSVFINSHAKSKYADIAMVLFEIRKAGIKEIGFIGIERF